VSKNAGQIRRGADRCPASLDFELCLVNSKSGRGLVWVADAERGSAAMRWEKLRKVSDRVNVEGHQSVFFVLNEDRERCCAFQHPNDSGPILDEISVDIFTILPRPDPNGATRA
jgi:hypothetical protein